MNIPLGKRFAIALRILVTGDASDVFKAPRLVRYQDGRTQRVHSVWEREKAYRLGAVEVEAGTGEQ